MLSNFYSKFFKNFGVSALYTYSSKFVSFLSSIIITRLLSPEDFGVVAVIFVFTEFINVFAEGGISFAVIRSDYRRLYHTSLASISIIVGIALQIVTIILAPFIVFFYSNQELFWPTLAISFLFLTRSLSVVQSALLSKELRFHDLGKAILLHDIIYVTTTIAFALLNFSFWSIIIGNITGSIAKYIFVSKKTFTISKISKINVLYKSFTITKSLLYNVIGFRVINYWSRNADNLLIGKMYSIHDLGIYERAYRLFTLPISMLTGVISQVLLPSLKQLQSENASNKTLLNVYFNIIRIIDVTIFPISVVFILFPSEFINIIWGEKWAEVSEILPYFGVLILSQSIISSTGNVLVLLNKEKSLRNAGIFSAIFLVSGIILGALQSFQSIPLYYGLSFVLFVIPYNLYFIFYKTIGFSLVRLIIYWLPRVLVYLILLFSINENDTLLVYTIVFMSCIIVIEFIGLFTPKLVNLIKLKV